MKTFKQYISEGYRRTSRQYAAGVRLSREEDSARQAFNSIMNTTPTERLLSDLAGREDPSNIVFRKADTGVLRMMSRAAAKPTGTNITAHVKNIYNALRTGSTNSRNMADHMKMIRAKIDLMKAGDRGEYGSLIPEI